MKRIALLIALCVAGFSIVRLAADDTKSSPSKSGKAASKDRSAVVVKVNGQPITTADWQFFVETRKLADEDVSAHRDDIIERLIERQLLREFLVEKKASANPKLVDEYITRLKLRSKDRGKDFDVGLKKSGFTEDSLRRELSLPLDWDAYVHKQVTDSKLRETWDKRRREFDGSEVRAAHIVLKSNDPAADEKTLAQVREKIVAKDISFADAAAKHSMGPSAKNGGDLGRFSFRSPQPQPFPQVAFALKAGEVSQPFRSPFGVHLLTVTQQFEGQLSLEDARRDIEQQLSAEMQREVLQQLLAKAKIERINSKP